MQTSDDHVAKPSVPLVVAPPGRAAAGGRLCPQACDHAARPPCPDRPPNDLLSAGRRPPVGHAARLGDSGAQPKLRPSPRQQLLPLRQRNVAAPLAVLIAANKFRAPKGAAYPAVNAFSSGEGQLAPCLGPYTCRLECPIARVRLRHLAPPHTAQKVAAWAPLSLAVNSLLVAAAGRPARDKTRLRLRRQLGRREFAPPVCRQTHAAQTQAARPRRPKQIHGGQVATPSSDPTYVEGTSLLRQKERPSRPAYAETINTAWTKTAP